MESVVLLEIKNNSDYGEIYIYGDVTTDSSGLWSYEDVCPSIIVDQIKELKNKPLNIRLNSCGGSVFGGIAIYNTLKSYKGYKTVYIDGCACSIASVIAMCADKIVMCKNSYLMIHSAWVGGVQGNAEEMRKVAETLNGLTKEIEEKVAAKCEKKKTKIIEEELEVISKKNIEISTLINYLNNVCNYLNQKLLFLH